jgi:predicted Fe-S protein YdhL (DUF1289 family)
MSSSFCVSICEYEDYNAEPKVCKGCGRTSEEITEWFYASEERKREIVKSIRKRNKERKSVKSLTSEKETKQ